MPGQGSRALERATSPPWSGPQSAGPPRPLCWLCLLAPGMLEAEVSVHDHLEEPPKSAAPPPHVEVLTPHLLPACSRWDLGMEVAPPTFRRSAHRRTTSKDGAESQESSVAVAQTSPTRRHRTAFERPPLDTTSRFSSQIKVPVLLSPRLWWQVLWSATHR